MLVARLALQQVKEVGTVTQKEFNTECKILTYISLVLNNLWPSDGCDSALQKIKLVQKTLVL